MCVVYNGTVSDPMGAIIQLHTHQAAMQDIHIRDAKEPKWRDGAHTCQYDTAASMQKG